MRVCFYLGDPFQNICVDEDFSIQHWFHEVFKKSMKLGCLAGLLAWELWKSRNRQIFDNGFSEASRVACVIQSFAKDFDTSHMVLPHPIDRHSWPPHLLRSGTRARFDGATTVANGKCGVGAFIECSNGDLVYLWMHGGVGMNTKGELLALWLVLFFSSRANIILDQIAGDSLAIVDWEISKATINSIALSSWLSHTRTLLDNFPRTSIVHIFRELNAVADSLSQRGLNAEEGRIFYQIWEGSQLTSSGFWNFFLSSVLFLRRYFLVFGILSMRR